MEILSTMIIISSVYAVIYPLILLICDLIWPRSHKRKDVTRRKNEWVLFMKGKIENIPGQKKS